MQSPVLSGVKLSFDSVFCYVTDLERSLNFYRNTLELPLVSRDFVARFDIDGVLFELVPAMVFGNRRHKLVQTPFSNTQPRVMLEAG